MEVPEVEVQNLNSAFLCIQQHLPKGLTCEEITISMDAHKASWSALCTVTDDFPTPSDPKNCVIVKRLLQTSFGRYGVVNRVQVSIHDKSDGGVAYKWQVLIGPRYPRPRSFGVYIQETLQQYGASTSNQPDN